MQIIGSSSREINNLNSTRLGIYLAGSVIYG